ncbi:hypothetical protein Hypma_005237 [Hypsizygus marmoreus]|uniref:Uncharacterized protein n=1 Tax=Hypsizygus marmoreus TaxID=39966 RepID=A0A369J3Y9_HYPMA|nr:hypothetical protein Hypma_005237 [Hypsizygus marmoreus]
MGMTFARQSWHKALIMPQALQPPKDRKQSLGCSQESNPEEDNSLKPVLLTSEDCNVTITPMTADLQGE